MSEIKKYIENIASGENLSQMDSSRVFQIIMNGGATPAQIAAVIIGMRINEENIEEITGAAQAIRAKSTKLNLSPELRSKIIDTCGTGGDKKGTYNISTAVSLVVAACGVPVAKHGNVAVSSGSGSADVLTALGVNINTKPELAAKCLEQVNICFMMAPNYHKAMVNVAPTRRELGIRTIFNLLGPIVNPAAPEMQLMGVYDKKYVELLANVLVNLGSKSVMVVSGADGMDEISISDETFVTEYSNGEFKNYTITPEQFGFTRAPEDAILGGDASFNAAALKRVISGSEEGAHRDIILLNAGAALKVSGLVESIENGVKLAANSIDRGFVKETLDKLIDISNSSNEIKVEE
jgi:anthranilate phosphoribosyltransferase